MDQDTSGRVDLFLCAAAEKAVKTHLEPRLNGFPAWACGLGSFVAQTVKDAGITSKPIDIPSPLVEWLTKGGR